MDTVTIPDLGRVKAVVFDLDGVLFDSLESNVAFYNHVLAHFGKPPVPDHLRIVVHRESIFGSLQALLGSGSEYQAALKYCRHLDFTPFIAKLQLFPGVHDTLERIGGHLRLGVATNRIGSTIPALNHLDLLRFFEVVVTPADAGASKPEAKFMEHTLASMGLNRQEVVYVGDSLVDQQLCQAADVALIAFRSPELVAWAHARSMDGIPPLLGLSG